MQGGMQTVTRILEIARKRLSALLGEGLGDESGQSTVEYAYIAFAILAGGIAAGPWMMELIRALQSYYSGVFWVIQFPFV